MREPWSSQFRTYAKHVLAGSLFVSIVLCGCAAAFSLFATSISSLANADSANQQLMKRQQIAVAAPVVTEPETESSESMNPVQTIPDQSMASDGILSKMHSPIGDAMDNGGVVVGQKVQQAFGSMLKGVLTTLFLEQNDNPAPGPVTGGYDNGTTG